MASFFFKIEMSLATLALLGILKKYWTFCFKFVFFFMNVFRILVAMVDLAQAPILVTLQ